MGSLGRVVAPLQQIRAASQMAYSERRIVGYSREQMFDVVADVEKYREFVPWCRRSTVHHEGDHSLLADLEVGFQFINASYSSRVTHIRPSVVHATPSGEPPLASRIHFDLTFEFRNAAHARITHLFFDLVVQKQVAAFLQRAQHIYGEPVRPASAPEVLKYNS